MHSMHSMCMACVSPTTISIDTYSIMYNVNKCMYALHKCIHALASDEKERRKKNNTFFNKYIQTSARQTPDVFNQMLFVFISAHHLLYYYYYNNLRRFYAVYMLCIAFNVQSDEMMLIHYHYVCTIRAQQVTSAEPCSSSIFFFNSQFSHGV